MAEVAPQPESIPPPQLRMVWPSARLDAPPEPRLHPDYALRTWRPGDEQGWFELMALAGFGVWDEDRLAFTLKTILPDGWFFAVEERSGRLVASAMATHHALMLHPFGGELGWVVGHPAHRGKGLGWTVCAAVTRRLLQAGYTNIFLRTDDFRLPAITVYLKLGYQPFLFAPDMVERWQAICQQLHWPFTPHEWPKV